MYKLRVLAQKCAYTVATVATKGGNTVATLFSQSGSTVATLNCTLHSLLSRLKTPFNSLVSGSSVGTSPNFAQEQRFPDSWELGDEYDQFDYDEWWEDNNIDWWDDLDEHLVRQSWQQEAVDEAIDDEQPGEHPPGDRGSIDW